MTPIGGILKLDKVKFPSKDGADTEHQTEKKQYYDKQSENVRRYIENIKYFVFVSADGAIFTQLL